MGAEEVGQEAGSDASQGLSNGDKGPQRPSTSVRTRLLGSATRTRTAERGRASSPAWSLRVPLGQASIPSPHTAPAPPPQRLSAKADFSLSSCFRSSRQRISEESLVCVSFCPEGFWGLFISREQTGLGGAAADSGAGASAGCWGPGSPKTQLQAPPPVPLLNTQSLSPRSSKP